MRENESKRSLAWPWYINGASEAGKKQGLFSAVAPQWGREAGHGPTELTHSAPDTQKAPVMGAEMAVVPQGISSGYNPQR